MGSDYKETKEKENIYINTSDPNCLNERRAVITLEERRELAKKRYEDLKAGRATKARRKVVDVSDPVLKEKREAYLEKQRVAANARYKRKKEESAKKKPDCATE